MACLQNIIHSQKIMWIVFTCIHLYKLYKRYYKILNYGYCTIVSNLKKHILIKIYMHITDIKDKEMEWKRFLRFTHQCSYHWLPEVSISVFGLFVLRYSL